MGKMSVLRRSRVTIAAALVAVAFGSLAGAAEDPMAKAPGHMLYSDPAVPDISGLYLAIRTGAKASGLAQMPTGDEESVQFAPWPAPLTAPYRKQADDWLTAARAGRALGDIGARCLPYGMPFVLDIGVFPDEIIQTPGVVAFMISGALPIMVWTDGRPHPKDLKPSYNGHSVGRWVGDTLHVDTVGILPTTPIDAGPRTPHSDKLHMTWTVRRVSADVLHMHMTLYDPEAFTEPMVLDNIWRRKVGADWQVLDDASCFDNNRNQTDDQGVPGFQKF